jgi:hypothetical protein
MKPRFWLLICLVISLSSAVLLRSQNLLPNPGFEDGTAGPTSWKASGGGVWSDQPFAGKRALRVEGSGNESGAWRTGPVDFLPGGLYQLRFMARRERETSGGCAISGPSRVNRDFQPGDSWGEHKFVFCFPHDAARDEVRLGHWEMKGAVLFDDEELLPAKATHLAVSGGIELGEGERFHNGLYAFQPNFGWAGANFHRPLHSSRIAFSAAEPCSASRFPIICSTVIW